MKIKVAVSIALVLVVTFIAFYPVLKNDFTNWDDHLYVTENNAICAATPDNLKHIATSFFASHYQPVTILSYLLEYRFFKLNPFYYHLTNLVLHLLNCALVFWLIYLFTGQALAGFITALFFGIHPLQAESVAWVSQRKTLLYTFFYLGALVSYLYYLRKQNPKYLFFCLIGFILSLLSKSLALTLPLVMLLLDYFTLRKINRQVLIEKIPYFVLSLFFGLMAILASRASAPEAGKQTYDLLTRLMGISGDIIFYLGKLIYPVKLSVLYPYYDNIKNNPFYLSSLVMVIAIAAGIFVSARYSKKIIFGAGFFLLTIFPAVQFLPQPDILTADHYVYLPCIGIFYLLAQVGLWLYQRKARYWRLTRVILVSVMAAVVVFLGCLSWQRSQVWKDSLTLWDDTLKNYPQVVKAYVNRGEFFLEKGQYAKAGSDFMIALNLDCNCYEAYFNLAVLSNILGNYDEGIDFVKKALKINPVFWKAHNLLAVLYGKAGKPALVIDVCRNLIELDSDSVEAYVNLCGAYGNLGDYQQAIAYGRKAVALDPYAASAQINLAVAYYYTKQYDLAIWHCNQAIKLGYSVSQEFLKAIDDVR